MSRLAKQDEAADKLMAQAGRTFYRAARLLPRSLRHSVVRLYSFCRTIDDLADEPGRSLDDRCDGLSLVATAFDQGDAATLQRAGWTFAPTGTMATAGQLLVLAAKADLQQKQPGDEQQLLAYAFGVAGTVGLMMAEVLGAKNEGLPAAVALGMAMQLSNIARDVAEDFSMKRIYLPATWVRSEDVSLALLSGTGASDASAVLKQATRRTLALADQLYSLAFTGMAALPVRVRWSILAAGLCYREIGVQVGHNVELSWKRRTTVSSGRKLQLILLAAVRLLRPRSWSSMQPTPTSIRKLDVLGETAQQHCRTMVLRAAA